MRNSRIVLLLAALLPVGFAGCNACYNSNSSTPDQIREKTADATAQAKQSAKAVVEGMREGLTRPTPDKPMDVNHASRSALVGLPGIDDATADRIIAGRPYSSEHQLLERRIVSREQYNRIADSITVGAEKK